MENPPNRLSFLQLCPKTCKIFNSKLQLFYFLYKKNCLRPLFPLYIYKEIRQNARLAQKAGRAGFRSYCLGPPHSAAAPRHARAAPAAPKQAAGPKAAMADDPVRNASSNTLDAMWNADSASARRSAWP